MDPEEQIIKTIAKWAMDNGFEIIVPKDEAEIDFVNVNFRSKQIYVGNMNIDNMVE